MANHMATIPDKTGSLWQRRRACHIEELTADTRTMSRLASVSRRGEGERAFTPGMGMPCKCMPVPICGAEHRCRFKTTTRKHQSRTGSELPASAGMVQEGGLPQLGRSMEPYFREAEHQNRLRGVSTLTGAASMRGRHW